jgi:hypothetical protein
MAEGRVTKEMEILLKQEEDMKITNMQYNPYKRKLFTHNEL